MSIAKTVVTGTIFRAPETRYTQNNIAVSAFVLNIGGSDEMLIRVISRRQALEDIINTLQKGEKVLVEGRLQTNSSKMEDGSTKTIYEIDASTIEKFGDSSVQVSSDEETGDIVQFEGDDTANELIGEDEIPF